MSAVATVLTPLLVMAVPTAISTGAAVVAWNQKRQGHAQRVDGQAYDRAQAINDQIVQALREEIDRLQRELADMRQVMAASAGHAEDLERNVAALQRTVDRMSRLLEEHGIEAPEPHY